MFSYPLVLRYVLGAQKNRLVETALLSTHNMFWLRNKKNIFLLHTTEDLPERFTVYIY